MPATLSLNISACKPVHHSYLHSSWKLIVTNCKLIANFFHYIVGELGSDGVIGRGVPQMKAVTE